MENVVVSSKCSSHKVVIESVFLNGMAVSSNNKIHLSDVGFEQSHQDVLIFID